MTQSTCKEARRHALENICSCLDTNSEVFLLVRQAPLFSSDIHRTLLSLATAGTTENSRFQTSTLSYCVIKRNFSVSFFSTSLSLFILLQKYPNKAINILYTGLIVKLLIIFTGIFVPASSHHSTWARVK